MAIPTVGEDREKADVTLDTWGDYVSKIINHIISRHPDAIKLILVNDPYDLPFSLKDGEHDRKMYDRSVPRDFPKLKDRFPSASYNSKIFSSVLKINVNFSICSRLSLAV